MLLHTCKALKNIHSKNINRLIFPHLTVNSLRKKFDSLQYIINKNDVVISSETKTVPLFPRRSFNRNVTQPRRHYLVCKRRYPLTLVIFELSIQIFFVEINRRKNKWLLCYSYNPKKNLIANYINSINRSLDSQVGQYENLNSYGGFQCRAK